MAKTLGLDIVIGSAVAGALNGFRSVIGEANKLGSTIEKLNNEKLTILDSTPAVKKLNDRLSTLNQTLDSLYKRKKDLQLKKALAKTDEEAKKINEELKVVNKRISALNRQKLNIKEDLKKAKEEAKKTNLEFRALNRTVEKLTHLKLKLQTNQLKREVFKNKIFDTIAIGVTASYPVRKAIEFESAMADVVKVANLSESETIKMSKALEKLSTKIPIAADGLAQIAAAGAQLGISKDKLIDFTNVVAKMSTAFDMSAEEAGESIAKLMNVYNLALRDVQKLGDAINYLSDNTAAKSRDLVNVLARIGGTAKMFGLSAKQAAALADAFLAMGKPPEVAATAINALLIKLQTADAQGKKFQDGLKALGLNAIDIKFAIKNDPQKAIMVVLSRIKSLDKQTQMNILSNLFGAEYADDIALLVSGLNNYKKALNLVAKEENYRNSMQKEFENRSKTTANQLQLLGNALNRIAIDLGSVVLPVLKTFAEWGVKISNAIADFNQEFPMLSKAIGYLTIGLGSFLVVGAGVGYFLTFIIGGITRFRIALTFLSKVTKFNRIEILLLDKVQKLYNATILTTKANLIGLKNSLSSFSLKTSLAKAKVTSLTIAKKTWAFATRTLSKSIKFLETALKIAGKGALWFLTTLKKGMVLGYNTALKILSWSVAKTKLVFNSLGKSLLFVGSKLKTAGIYAYNLALKTLSITASLTTNALKFAGRSLLWLGRVFLLNPIGLAITAIAAGAYLIYKNWDTLKNFFSEFWERIKSGFNVVVTFISNIFTKHVETISVVWTTLANWFGEFWSWVKERFSAGVTFIKNLFTHPVQTISTVWSGLANWFSGFWGNLTSGFSKGVGAITNIFLHPINTIQNLWNKLIGWIMDKVKWVASIGSKIKKFFGFGGDEEKKLTLKTVTEKVKPIVTAAVVSTTVATAQPTTLKPLQMHTVKPVTVPANTQQVQSVKNTQNSGPQTIYNFNFGDIKLDVKDGKIENVEEFKEIIKQAIEEMNFEHKQRSLSDVV